MKTSILTFTTLILISGSLLTNCNSSADNVQDAKEDLDQATKDMEKAEANYIEESKLFKLETEKKILKNDEQIAHLKTYSDYKKNELQDDYNLAVEELEKRNQFIKDRFIEFNTIDVEKWEGYRDQFNEDLDALMQAIKTLNDKREVK